MTFGEKVNFGLFNTGLCTKQQATHHLLTIMTKYWYTELDTVTNWQGKIAWSFDNNT
jgi:hypothetical protein